LPKREDTAERKFNLAPGCRKPAPRPQAPPANDHLKDDGSLTCMTTLHVDMQTRQCLQHSLIKAKDFVAASEVRVPGFIVLVRRRSEGANDAFKVMLIFVSNVLVYKLEASRPVINIHSGHNPNSWLIAF
jgi:hypothetical protein